MKNLFIIFALFAAVAAYAQPISKLNEGLVKVKVTRVWDGDSFIAKDTAGQAYEIRLALIDCPEILGYSTKAQPYSRQATDTMKALILGKNILLDTLVLKGDRQRDKWGRLLANAYFPSGESIQFLLVEKGLAWHVPNSDTRSRKLSGVLKAEMAEAKSDKRGLFASYIVDGKIARIYTPATWRAKYSRM